MKHHSPSWRLLPSLALSLVLAGCANTPAPTQTTAQPPVPKQPAHPANYFDAASVKLSELLPKPSADKSPISKGEGDFMLALQAEASPAAKDRAKAEEDMTPWIFAEVLGPSFSKEKMPLTAAMLDKIEKDTHAVTEAAKQVWDRARPPRQDARIYPLLVVPRNASYPSGHATRAIVWSRVLTAFSPKDKDALRQRARLVALDRVIMGVHYPTDVAAGVALGDAIADQLLASPAFKSDMEKAKAEWKH